MFWNCREVVAESLETVNQAVRGDPGSESQDHFRHVRRSSNVNKKNLGSPMSISVGLMEPLFNVLSEMQNVREIPCLRHDAHSGPRYIGTYLLL